MSVIGPFQITEDEWSRSTTLTRRDVGRWALLVRGCYQFFDSFADALACRQHIERTDQ